MTFEKTKGGMRVGTLNVITSGTGVGKSILTKTLNEQQLSVECWCHRCCKDCKHYKKDWSSHIIGSGDTFDLCLHPLVTGNVVTGKNNGQYCDSTRKYHECGMIGKLWEAKK